MQTINLSLTVMDGCTSQILVYFSGMALYQTHPSSSAKNPAALPVTQQYSLMQAGPT
mgnify:CR=1 FL=1